MSGQFLRLRIFSISQKSSVCRFNSGTQRLFGSTAENRQASWNHDVQNVISILRGAASSDPIPVTVQAIVRTIRKQKKHAFLKLGDGSTTRELQVLLSPAQSEGLTTGTSVKISGILQPCPPGLQQSHELHAKEVDIIGQSDGETYPIQKKYQSVEFLRTLPHLRLRTPWNGLLARLKSDVDFSCTEWFRDNDFVRVYPPVITSSDCEGAGEVFTVAPAYKELVPDNATKHFFQTPKYLTVSSQLHLEAYVHAHRAVWCLGPTFRAEKSNTPRHLSEFSMLEAEIQTSSLSSVMNIIESLLNHIAKNLITSNLSQEILSHHNTTGEDTEFHITGSALESRWQGLLTPTYPRITYTEAISHLQTSHLKTPFALKPEWGTSLALEHEKHIAAIIGKGTTPVFVTDYPTSIKPFYMLPSSSTEHDTSASFDLLLPELAELAGGSLRHHNLEALQKSMSCKNIAGDGLDWYTQLRQYGTLPHGGFGLGFDRLLCYLVGEANIRELVGWPRWAGRCDG